MRPKRGRLALAGAVSLFLPAAIVTVAQAGAARELRPVVIVDPAASQGQWFSLLDYVGDAERADLATGRRTVVLINRRCQTCTDYLNDLARRHDAGTRSDAVQVIDVSAEGEAPGAFEWPFRQVTLRRGVLYAVNVPLEVSLDNGVVKSVRRAASKH
jgi:hypothetical protein